MKDTQVQKLITVTRQDLKPGYQAVQAAHSAIEFQHEYSDIAKKWTTESKYLIFLSISDELKLKELIKAAHTKNIKHTIFREPDIDNQITSVTFEPTEDSKKLCKKLPLMLK